MSDKLISTELPVQKVLQDAIFLFSQENTVVNGAGRTDSGVHALSQVANIFLDTNWSNDNIKNAFGNKGNINGYSNYAFMGRCNTNPKILNVGNKFSF